MLILLSAVSFRVFDKLYSKSCWTQWWKLDFAVHGSCEKVDVIICLICRIGNELFVTLNNITIPYYLIVYFCDNNPFVKLTDCSWMDVPLSTYVCTLHYCCSISELIWPMFGLYLQILLAILLLFGKNKVMSVSYWEILLRVTFLMCNVLSHLWKLLEI